MEIERSKKLLLVEDEAIISMVTAKMLRRSGYEVITVNNGKNAVETALTDTSIDLILMDIDLGAGINGPEAARQILQMQNLPIVFLTSHSEQDVVEMVREITRYGYVIKNSGDFVLLSSIEMAFELFASHERLKASADLIRESEEKVRLKLDTILSPEGDVGEFELEDIVDIKMLQSVMDDLNSVSDVCMAIVDVKGKVLVATGWQDICTKFHRVNPDSCRNCVESDTVLSKGIDNGAYKLYKCRNNMWDVATPIFVGGKHMGNVFMGQFLFDDDVPDYDYFRSQAAKFGYDEKEYLAALDRVPRLGKDLVFNTMTFLIKLANIISKLSYSNLKLARTLSERDRYSDLHRESEARLSDITDHMVDLVARLDRDGFFTYASPSYERLLGYRPDELMGTWAPDLCHPTSREKDMKNIKEICEAGEGFAEFRMRHKGGEYRWFEASGRNIYDEQGSVTGTVMGARDITGRKKVEKKLSRKDRQYKELFESMIDGFAIHEMVLDEWGNPVDYIFLEVNPAFEQITGLSAQAITGKKVSEIIPDLEPYWIATYGQVALTGVQLTIENFSSQLNKWFKVTAFSYERGFFATIFEDITDRKIVQEQLKERDERYKRLFESVVGYVYTVVIENKIPVKTVHGPGCEAITGYSPEDFLTDPELWYKVIYPDDRGRVILFASDIINKGIFKPIEHRIICRDGSVAWVRNTPVPHYDSEKNLIEYDSVIADITERKNAENMLNESREMLLNVINSSPDYIFVKDKDLRLVLCNEVYAAAVNSTPAQLIGKNDIDSGWGEEFVKGNIQKGIRGYENDDIRALSGEKVLIEKETRIVNGEIHHFDTLKVPLYRSGEVTSLLGISRDITIRQSADNEKKEAIDIMRIINTDADLHDLMKSVIVFLRNWSGCEAIGIRLREGDDYPYFETDGFSREFIKLENSLCTYDITGQLLRDDIGNPVIECMCGNIISSRFDPSKSFFTSNGSFWSNCTTDLLRSTTDADRQARTRNRCNGMGYESVALIPLRIGNKTFGLMQLNDKKKGMFTEELISLLERLASGIALALSDRIKSKELAESFEKYKTVADFTYDWEFWIGTDGRMIYCSPSCERITGYTSNDFMNDPELFRKIIFFEDRNSPCMGGDEISALPESNETEFRITRKDGRIMWIGHVCRAVYDSAGNFAGRRGSNRDITEQKLLHMETEKARSRLDDLWNVAIHADESMKSLCDKILSTIVRITNSRYGFYGFINEPETEMTIFSWSGEAMKDCSIVQKPQNYKIDECGVWAEAVRKRSDLIINDYKADHAGKKGYPQGHVELDNLMVVPAIIDGRIKSVAAVANSETGYSEVERLNLKIYLTSIQAIIEKKKSDEKLRESEFKLKAMMNSTTDGAFLMTPDGVVLEANKTLADRFGLTVEQMIGKNMYDVIPPENAASRRRKIEEVLKTGQAIVFEDVRNGICLESHIYPIKNEYDEIISLSVFSRDITESREYFEKINSLLKEKEMLLGEVHHRIKNNMNTISGLLMLQAASISEPAAITALNDARSRVQSMMIMYDKLYRSEDYRKMPVKEYLEKFIDEIFLIFENSRQVKIEKDIADFSIDTKILFPIGIIINELITNAFKYAFPDGREGKIIVSVSKAGDEVTLTVKDDGAGIPDKVASSSSGGFGLNLVSALTEQIGGELKIRNDNGTVVEIVFMIGA